MHTGTTLWLNGLADRHLSLCQIQLSVASLEVMGSFLGSEEDICR